MGFGAKGRWLTAVVAAVALTGCQRDLPPGEGALAGACQFKYCVCEQTGVPFWQAVDRPVDWTATGDAACPEGYRLILKNKS